MIICFFFCLIANAFSTAGLRGDSASNSCIVVRHSQRFCLSCSYRWSGVAPGLVSYSLFITPCTAIDWLLTQHWQRESHSAQSGSEKPGRLPWTLHHLRSVVLMLNQWKHISSHFFWAGARVYVCVCVWQGKSVL